MHHVIWDWNGTLLDDLTIVVDSVNASLRSFGAGPITADDYRDHYTRPVYRFYERLLGREVTAAEWESIDVVFHDAYRSMLGGAALTADAAAALATAARRRASQSLLSMWWHDELVPAADAYDVARWMVRIDGNRGEAGETKVIHLERHLVALAAIVPGLAATDCVVIGDSLDDAVAAGDVGVPCVLYDGGSHHRAELDAAGVPVAATLVEALALAGIG
jgi:phosphoglycolate phosphatase-like HAD superfamily hydrolase